ncbi:MAG: hypothetical protein H7249_15640 [Chitinophagaceae bacterium]|nr:hypothetical protein [Oligoflexus sp.]
MGLKRYATLFHENGFERQRCRIQVYGHNLASGRDVIEWTKGSYLTRFQTELSVADFQYFVGEYTKRLIAKIGEGPYFYTYKRMFFWASKARGFFGSLAKSASK